MAKPADLAAASSAVRRVLERQGIKLSDVRSVYAGKGSAGPIVTDVCVSDLGDLKVAQGVLETLGKGVTLKVIDVDAIEVTWS